MSSVSLETPPENPTELVTWLVQRVAEINAGLAAATVLEPTRGIPIKPVNGKLYYFEKPITKGATSLKAGFYGYHKGNWIELGVTP